ncbi:MAG: hypothetical protein HGA73_01940 [Syntrophaceae bacterium]|jgi:hypothetical protein|nr:hypothetical protein [Syntrophaceae bacterium]
MKKTSIAMLVVCALIVSTAPAFGEATDGMGIVADVLIARPVGLVSVVFGTVMYVVALPFSIPSGSVEKTGQLLVEEPFKYTFFRPLGDFSFKAGMAAMPATGGAK